MVIADRTFTEEEFEQFILLPEHGDTLFELINGKAYPAISSNYCSHIAAKIAIPIGAFVKQNGLGYVTGADGGYKVAGQRYIPDVAFMSKARQPNSSDDTYNDKAPDLAVEVLSPTDIPANIRIKISNYMVAGTVVWIVNPDNESVEIYELNKPAVILTKTDTISGGTVLSGLQIPVKDIFD